MEKLIKIQNELKAPKNQFNGFGKYKYRSCEDILEALKPLLLKHGCTLVIDDTVKEAGGMVYIEARAVISDGEKQMESYAQAGINPDKKGMDIAQSFGSSSSYARKYALNGLFLIDDSKDADTEKPAEPAKKANIQAIDPKDLSRIAKAVADVGDLDELQNVFKSDKQANLPQI
ncbi:MAG TPA: ERF family protein, partial [Pricia sp.]|nr:ERF family protein [Pricia sp.]